MFPLWLKYVQPSGAFYEWSWDDHFFQVFRIQNWEFACRWYQEFDRYVFQLVPYKHFLNNQLVFGSSHAFRFFGVFLRLVGIYPASRHESFLLGKSHMLTSVAKSSWNLLIIHHIPMVLSWFIIDFFPIKSSIFFRRVTDQTLGSQPCISLLQPWLSRLSHRSWVWCQRNGIATAAMLVSMSIRLILYGFYQMSVRSKWTRLILS